MTGVAAKFPANIWDGKSSTRSGGPLVDAPPDARDWDQVVAEVIAAQTKAQEIDQRFPLDGGDTATIADANVVGGIPVIHRIDVPDGATGDVNVVLTHKTRIIDVHLVKTVGAGGASDTIQVKNGASAISNAMSINVADQTVVRAGTIDDAQHEVAAGGTLRVTRTKVSAANVACVVYVTGIRVA